MAAPGAGMQPSCRDRLEVVVLVGQRAVLAAASVTAASIAPAAAACFSAAGSAL